MISTTLLYFTLPTLIFVIVASLLRFYWGPSIADRVVVWDLLSAVLLALNLVFFIDTQETYLVDIFLIVSILSFLSTVGYAYMIDREKVAE